MRLKIAFATLVFLCIMCKTIYCGDMNLAHPISKNNTDLNIQWKMDEPQSYFSIPDASDCQEDIEDLHTGPYEVLAQLVQAEAGNQGLLGNKLVVDVVLNRIDSTTFPDDLEGVIFQNGQFTCINNGQFDKAGWSIDPDCYKAVEEELRCRTNYDVLYFSRGKSPYADTHFKIEDHWFSY